MLDVRVIILAGGQSSRYNEGNNTDKNNNTDKLLSKKGNLTVLEYVIKQTLTFSNHIVVVTRNIDRKNKYFNLIKQNFSNKDLSKITFLLEKTDNPIGPLGGIKTSLDYLEENIPVLVIPADLPYITGKILKLFVQSAFDNPKASITSILHSNGQVEHLVIAFMSKYIKKIVDKLYSAKCNRSSSIIRFAQTKKFIKSSYLFSGEKKQKNHLLDLDVYKVEEFQSNVLFNEDNELQNDIQKDYIANSDSIIFFDNNDNNNPSIFYSSYINNIVESNVNSKEFPQNDQIIKNLMNENQFYQKEGIFSLALHCLLDLNKIINDSNTERMIKELKQKLS